MNEYNYTIRAAEVSSPRDPKVLGEKVLETVEALARIDSLGGDWGFCTSPTGWKVVDDDIPWRLWSLDQVRQNLVGFVEACVVRDDFHALDPDRGYTFIAGNSDLGNARTVGLTLTAGASKTQNNDWSISTGFYPTPVDDSILTYPIFRSIFSTLIVNWPCSWACVQGSKRKTEWRSREIGNPPISVKSPITTFKHTIYWMGYLSAELAKGCEPPVALAAERTVEGGLMLAAFQDRPDPGDADQMRRSDLLGSIMDKTLPDPFAEI